MDKLRAHAEIKRHIKLAEEFVSKIGIAQNSEELRNSWEGFLSEFARSMGRIIKYSTSASTELKTWGYRLKTDYNANDAGLVYLREARNVAEHGLIPFAEFIDAAVNIGGCLTVIGGSSNIIFSNNFVNGTNTGNFEVAVKEGKILNVQGRINTPITNIPTRVNLHAVRNPEKNNRTYPPPDSIFKVKLNTGDAASLASAAMDGLNRTYSTMETLDK
jgi:hypothetical protein